MGRTASRGQYRAHPAPKYRDRIRLVQGRRAAYPDLWEAQFRADSTQPWGSPRTLKTADLDTAGYAAIELLGQLDAGGLPTVKRVKNPFRVSAEKTITRLEAEQRDLEERLGVTKGRKISLKLRIIKTVLIPTFGDRDLSELTDDALETWARGYRVRGPEGRQVIPRRSTMGNINGALQEVLTDARDHGLIRKSDIGKIDQQEFELGERRPAFTASEMRRIAEGLSEEWIEAGHTARIRENRIMLRALIALLATTGLRPGDETYRITPEQIDLDARDSNGSPAVRIHIRARQGKYVIARDVWINQGDPAWPSANTILRDYLLWLADNDTEEREANNPLWFIFARPSDGKIPNFHVPFRLFLHELGLRRDPETGHDRTLYSLRHYYATEALLRGLGVGQVVGVLGTSLAMLDRHYSHVINRLQSGNVTGSAEQAKRKMTALRARRAAGVGRAETHYPDGTEIEEEAPV